MMQLRYMHACHSRRFCHGFPTASPHHVPHLKLLRHDIQIHILHRELGFPLLPYSYLTTM